MLKDIVVPATGGEYMDAVVVVEWRTQPQETVSEGQVVAIVETAKTTIEIEAPAAGTLIELLAQPGEEVDVGSALARMQLKGASTTADMPVEQAEAAADAQPATQSETSASADTVSAARMTGDGGRIIASPAARKQAQALGISLVSLQASSPSGRIKLRDLPVHDVSLEYTADSDLYIERRGSGNGTPLIFIHGYGADLLGWTPLVGKLSANTPICLLELPGHGRSSAIAPGSDVHAMVNQVAATLKRAGIETGHLIGHSLGGAVAIALAANTGFQAASLCLIAPAGLGPDVNGEFLAGIARANSTDSLHPWLRQLTSNGRLVDRTFAEMAMKQRSDPQLRHRQLEMASTLFPDGTQATDLRAALHTLQVPCRIIWGRDDAIIPWRHAWEAGWRAGVHLMPAVGHLPHIEAPAEVACILADLLSSTVNATVTDVAR